VVLEPLVASLQTLDYKAGIMIFQQVNDPITGSLDTIAILYTDPNGVVWTVPQGHRIWIEIYEPWLAAGNTPQPPATS
jgi:hypothetical protein